MTDPRTWTASQAHNYALALVIGMLSVTSLLKVAEIQYLEYALAVDLVILLAAFLWNRMRLKVYRPFLDIGLSYILFMVLAFVLAIIALRGDYFANLGFFKRPIVVTASRIGELILDVFYMLYMASLYRRDEAFCRFTCMVYYWMGMLGGAYNILTFPLNYFFQLQLGTYQDIHRLRGFANEGGSYGIYVLSVILLIIVMARKGWLTRGRAVFSLFFMTVMLAGSQSKSAFLAGATIGLLQVVLTVAGWRRWATLGVAGAAIAVVAVTVDIPGQINVYLRSSEEYVQLSNIRWGDGNYVAGRISGAVFAPRMIKAHPLTGIGWGNYPLVRDDPEYRQGTAFLLLPFDAPGLGVIDYIVDLGIPLWLYLTWITLKPAVMLRRRRADPWLIGLAMLLPVGSLYGTHLNITYPWVVVGMALGLGFSQYPWVAASPRLAAGTSPSPQPAQAQA